MAKSRKAPPKPTPVARCSCSRSRGRPPKNWTNVERLLMNGTFIPDDGKPGVAFVAQDERGFPMALYADDGERFCYAERCPKRVATDHCAKRHRCANGHGFKDL